MTEAQNLFDPPSPPADKFGLLVILTMMFFIVLVFIKIQLIVFTCHSAHDCIQKFLGTQSGRQFLKGCDDSR